MLRQQQRRCGDHGDHGERPAPANCHREHRRGKSDNDSAERDAGLLDREQQVAALGGGMPSQQEGRRRTGEPHSGADEERSQRDEANMWQREQSHADDRGDHAHLGRPRGAPAQHDEPAVDGSDCRRAESKAHVVADQHRGNPKRFGHLGRNGGEYDIRHRDHHLRGGSHQHDKPGRSYVRRHVQ
jgi:hypothetical protein